MTAYVLQYRYNTIHTDHMIDTIDILLTITNALVYTFPTLLQESNLAN